MNAQEVAVWKKVIRVIAHEINNSVAPIASLAQSGQRLLQQPDTAQLQRVFTAIDDRMSHLSQFVDDYSRFAKLPRPRCGEVELAPIPEVAADRDAVHAGRRRAVRAGAGSTNRSSSRS